MYSGPTVFLGVKGCPEGGISPLHRVRCSTGKSVLLPRPRQLGSTSGKSRTSPIYDEDPIPALSSRMVKALALPSQATCAPLLARSVQKSSHKSQIGVHAEALEGMGQAPFPQPCSLPLESSELSRAAPAAARREPGSPIPVRQPPPGSWPGSLLQHVWSWGQQAGSTIQKLSMDQADWEGERERERGTGGRGSRTEPLLFTYHLAHIHDRGCRAPPTP